MPISTETLHNDVALANVSLAYKNPLFIGLDIAKVVPVDKQSNKYWVYDKEIFRTEDDQRKAGSKFKQIDWGLTDETFFCEGHGLEAKVPIEWIKNEDPGLDVLADGAEEVTGKIQLNLERNIANTLTALASYAAANRTTLAGAGDAEANQWTVGSTNNGSPFAVAKSARAAIQKGTGRLPNTLVLGREVYEVLREHPEVIERVKYSERAVITADILASLFDVDRVLVGEAMYDTAKKGQTASLSYIWGKHAFWAYVPDRPKQKEVALMYVFRWKDAPNATEGVSVVKYWDQSVKSWMVQGEWYYDYKMIANTAGYLVRSAVA